jgi:DNA helicase-2/ATP-dependent DNA helicase PcrA
LEFALREQGIAYQMVNGLEFFQRKEIKDVLAYLHLLANPRDEVALLRVINTPTRGIGKTTLERLAGHATRRGLGLLDAARQVEHEKIPDIGPRPTAMLGKFIRLFDRLSAAVSGPIEELVGLVLSESGYQKMLRESENEDDQQRLANIEELLTVAREFDERHGAAGQLEAFLEETSLVNDTDAWETDTDRVTLMTLHASKGLEFPVVFLMAVEEGLLPHERSRRSLDQLEEERRLMFVGITRAQQELAISLARYRDFRGQRKLTIPSSFLVELPRDEMEIEYPGAMDQSATAADGFELEEPYSTSSRARNSGAVGANGGRKFTAGLTTAAAMANRGQTPSPTAADKFRQGMLVLHPEYGLGRIVALSGAGEGRKATVDFRHPACRKKFLLRDAALQAVGK